MTCFPQRANGDAAGERAHAGDVHLRPQALPQARRQDVSGAQFLGLQRSGIWRLRIVLLRHVGARQQLHVSMPQLAEAEPQQSGSAHRSSPGRKPLAEGCVETRAGQANLAGWLTCVSRLVPQQVGRIHVAAIIGQGAVLLLMCVVSIAAASGPHPCGGVFGRDPLWRAGVQGGLLAAGLPPPQLSKLMLLMALHMPSGSCTRPCITWFPNAASQTFRN